MLVANVDPAVLACQRSLWHGCRVAQACAASDSPSSAAASPRSTTGQARLYAGRLRPLRAQDRLRHAGPGPELHHPARPTQRARPWPGDRERADQRPAHRQQIGRRGRSAAAHVRPTNVDRIEIVDAASLGIAGLSGQVANVILKTTAKGSRASSNGTPSWRAHYAKPDLLGGSISYSGKTGPVDYTFSVKNGSGRGGLGGPIVIYDRNHVLTETRNEIYH